MRLPQLLAAAAAVMTAAAQVSAAPSTGYEIARAPYIAELDRQCPGRILEDLTPGDLDGVIERYEEALSKRELHRIARHVKLGCAHVIAGLGCANTRTIKVLTHLGKVRGLAAAACATGWRCTAPFECVQDAR